ncbi:MAG: O-methyltransferase [Stenotrophomonas sp.]|nr:MAG: O-methyltransferase [Stenotrophomonas sp.]
MAVAPIKTRALQLALDRDLFTRLSTPTSAATLAGELQLSPAHAALWLELLWSMQVLSRTAADPCEYMTSALAERYFRTGSDHSCAQAWHYRAGFLAAIADQLPHFVEHGRPTAPLPAASGGAGTWAQAAQVQIGQEQRAISVPLAMSLLERHQVLSPGMRFLDLGGGPGWLAIELARRCNDASGVVFDLPDTVAVAASNIAACHLQQRVSVVAGDLDQDDIGEDYNLIWCSSVLHFLRDPARAVARIQQALRPGGSLFIVHAESSGLPEHDLRVLPFYLPMRLRGNYLPGPGQLQQLLQLAGFKHVQHEVVQGFPMAPLTLYRGIA